MLCSGLGDLRLYQWLRKQVSNLIFKVSFCSDRLNYYKTGFVNILLSWKVFIPLGRLTYCVYLIHLNYIIFYYAHARKPGYYTTYEVIHGYFGILMTSFLLAFFVSVTIEAPLLNLEKLMFSPLNAKKVGYQQNLIRNRLV